MQPEKKYKRREARDVPGHAHLLTFSTRKRKPHLLNEQICLWLANSISQAKVTHDFQVLAYVFMPDHVHLLIRPQVETYKVAGILKSIKQGVSRRALNAKLIDEILWLANSWAGQAFLIRCGTVKRISASIFQLPTRQLVSGLPLDQADESPYYCISTLVVTSLHFFSTLEL